ncbi:competence protein ComK [Bacillus salitolerans]|uniref:Competence protein ComK n=1 Tax=Bacillus salitolerans TaxID=1437434 RepID=A0ABW4LVE4_9BACI
MKETVLKEYEISPYTMAVLPEVTERGLYSRIMEIETSYIVAMKPIEIMDRSCRFFGSSLQGRREGTREIMGITHKAPIVIDPSNYIYFFPTLSPSREQCAWISHAYVKSIKATEHQTTLQFSNHELIDLSISKGSLENQLYRTAQLRATLSSRIEPETRRVSFLTSSHHRLQKQ